MRLCHSAQKCAYLMGNILFGVSSSGIGMSANIVPITLHLALIRFFPTGNSFIFKDVGYCQRLLENSEACNNRDYYHKLTFSLGKLFQNTFFLNSAFP